MALDSLGITSEDQTVASASAHLDELCDRVADGKHAVIIRRRGKKAAVLFSAAELSSLCETVFLLGDPTVARRLFDALDRAEAGQGATMTLDELRRSAGLAATGSERAS